MNLINNDVTDLVAEALGEKGLMKEKEVQEYGAKKNWTVMVYLAGDSNLNVEMAYALEQIRLVTKYNENVSLYVYFDGFSEDVPTMYCDFSQAKAEFFQSRYIKDKLLTYSGTDDDPNENSAAISNVINFVDWCVKKDRKCKMDDGSIRDRRGEKNYAVIFSGHSFGFMDWGLFKDQKADYTMTLSKLAWMFERVTDTEETLKKKAERSQETGRRKGYKEWSEEKYQARTTEILGKPISLLGFDSCVLSTLEISSQFEGLAETIVSSEGSIPTAGWNYTQILLGKIKDRSATDPKTVAVSFVDEFIKQQSNFALADISVDMAAWDLSALPGLKSEFGTLAASLSACFDDDQSTEYHQMRRLLTFVHWQSQTYLHEQHVDLGDFCQLLIIELNLLQTEIEPAAFKKLREVRESCERIIIEIRRAIVLTGFSGRDYQYSNGVALFFPWSWESYKCAEKDYKRLSINKGNNVGRAWISFLEKYLLEVTLRPARAITDVNCLGTPIVIPGVTDSLVYRPFDVIDANYERGFGANAVAGKVEPNTLKVEPNTLKVEPNTLKVEPYGDKVEPNTLKEGSIGSSSTNVTGLILKHFMAVKNVRSRWNVAGFTSTQVPLPSTGQAVKKDEKTSRDLA